MTSDITVLIADDHPVFRGGLRQVIENAMGLRVVAEAENGAVALRLLAEKRPQVAVLDVDMPEVDGFEVVRTARRQRIEVEVVFLTMHKDEDVLNEALSLGVRGFIVKDSAVNDITESIRAVAAGQFFISPSMSGLLVKRNAAARALSDERPGLKTLTATELRVLQLLADYKTNKEIAQEMFLSYRTVENHRANICQKLDLSGPHALVKFAVEYRSHF
jgi:DNA-binding NarL/FixJ family response regulator